VRHQRHLAVAQRLVLGAPVAAYLLGLDALGALAHALLEHQVRRGAPGYPGVAEPGPDAA
jgi:hypothetical protein